MTERSVSTVSKIQAKVDKLITKAFSIPPFTGEPSVFSLDNGDRVEIHHRFAVPEFSRWLVLDNNGVEEPHITRDTDIVHRYTLNRILFDRSKVKDAPFGSRVLDYGEAYYK